MYYRTYSQQSSWQQCNGTVWHLGSRNLSSNGSRTCSTNGGVGFNSTDKETLGPWGGNYTRGFDGTGLHGYPGRDQPGITTGQVSSPIYVWHQTNDPGVVTWAGGDPINEALLATFIVNIHCERPGLCPVAATGLHRIHLPTSAEVPTSIPVDSERNTEFPATHLEKQG
jgi:hypothetical protein